MRGFDDDGPHAVASDGSIAALIEANATVAPNRPPTVVHLGFRSFLP